MEGILSTSGKIHIRFPAHIALNAGTRFLILLHSLIFLPAFTHAQVITTIIGTGSAGYNGDGISATTAQVFYPHNIAVDASGNIYFPDYGNSRIRKVTISTGLISTIAGTGTAGYNGDGIAATTAQLNQPTSLSFDNNGDLYFTDRANQRIRKITLATGIISTVAGTGTAGYNGDGIAAMSAQLNGPNEVAFDAVGNLFIADWFNQRVRKVDRLTGLISTIAGTGVAGYNGDGILATTAQVDGPCGIAFDNAGDIYIAAYSGQRIRKITIGSGLITTIAGTGTAGYNGDGIAATTAQFNWPAYISFDGAGNLYVGDDNGFRIRQIAAATGLISTIAGTGTSGYNGDGIAATTAQVNHAYYPYFDKNNCTLLVVDTYNHRIRKVTGGFTGCVPAVAPGNLISCQVLPAITIDNSNNTSWVPIYDSAGRIAAEINANGNNLGIVSTSLYTRTGPCREDWNNRLYLNRNITISPQVQPASNVSVRLYILKAELDSLKTALNSLGQPSGVASINEVAVFKNNDACAVVGSNVALPLTASTGAYNTNDNYLQVSVNSFSSFYFANKTLTYILPVKIKNFSGHTTGGMNYLRWEVQCNSALDFLIERSAGGVHFDEAGHLHATVCDQPFFFTDAHPLPAKNFYRLKILSQAGAVDYSQILLLENQKGLQIELLNRVVNNSVMDILVSSPHASMLTLIVSDASGRIVERKMENIPAGASHVSLNMTATAAGVYYLYTVGNEGSSKPVRFIRTN